MIPVCTALSDWNAICKCLAGFDPRKRNLGNAIHRIGKDQPVPVDRCVFAQGVADIDSNVFALFEAHQRPRNTAVHRHATSAATADFDTLLCDGQVIDPW